MLGGGCRGGFGDLGALRKIYFSAEDGIVFHRESQRANIAFDGATGTQFDAASSHNVSVNLALNQNVPCCEIRSNVRTWADGESALCQSYGSFDTPVDDQVFSALYFPANHDGLAYPSRTIFGCHGSIPFQNYLNFDPRHKDGVHCLGTIGDSGIRQPEANAAGSQKVA
jgi:hypothetical protein